MQRTPTTRREPLSHNDERGAVLVLVGVMLTVLMVVGALAVDLSALQRRGQSLQNTADAAALAGVAEWSEDGDAAAAEAKIRDLIQQNGIALTDDVELQIAFPSATEVSVELTDSDPDVFLSGLLGARGAIGRDATASIEQCNFLCNRTVLLPEPLPDPIETFGSGDGFTPIAIEDRLYAVNHHNREIACIERSTQQQCWAPQALFSGSADTGSTITTPVIDERIYYAGWDSWWRQTVVSCWDHSADARCSAQVNLGDHGHASIVEADGKLFVLTSSRKIFCLQPVTLSSCAGYWGGKDTALAAQFPWATSDLGTYAAVTVVHDQRIYHTNTTHNGGVFLHCWNAATDAACGSFGTHWLHTTGADRLEAYNNGRLFFYRDTSGDPTAICSIGQRSVECFDLINGSRQGSLESNLSGLFSTMQPYAWTSWAGTNTYHEYSNRLFLVGAYYSLTYCYDFTTESYCGGLQHYTALGWPQTYGYLSEGPCLIGLGDRSIFFTMDADMQLSCASAYTSVGLDPCTCSGVLAWPAITPIGTEDAGTFEARVIAEDGTLLLPDDGRDWMDLLTETLDLSTLDTNAGTITIEVFVESAPGQDAWSGLQTPGFVVGLDNRPQLVE